MLFLARYWHYIALGVVMIALSAIVLGWRADSRKLATVQESLQVAQMALDRAEKQAEIERQQANEYFENLNGVNRELSRLKRVRPSRCICPVSEASRACDAKDTNRKHIPTSHGITTESLYDFAADCDRVRVQRDACQKWVGGL